MRVVFSLAAKKDLERIDDYTLKQFGLRQAGKTLGLFRKAFEGLALYPRSAPARSELDPPGRQFRYSTVLRCLIIVYEPLEDRTRVARILDGRREDLSLLLQDEAGEGEST